MTLTVRLSLPICGRFADSFRFLLHLDGFQILHAIHAVETFLVKLKERRCIFNLLWFEKEADLCIPNNIRRDNARNSKYRLARAVLIQHFARAGPTVSGREPSSVGFSYVFPGLESRLFCDYLDTHPLHFFLGSQDNSPHEHPIASAACCNTSLGMLHLMASAGYCVAFIEGIEFKSSKVGLLFQSQHFPCRSTH